ncbi:ABC transporter permease [Pseudonocardia sp. GCM10023141]|uniref:ABC transporter permease n=1 Tax=Pseudonocardia sp. GCM10023141 TaxID=3252653 RepID=UPI0036130A1C
MIQYVIAGLVLGGIYAISSAALVVTYRASGVLNFSSGAIAYFVVRFYYFLNTQHGWDIVGSAALSLLVVGPGLGLLLYAGLFRHLRSATTVIKIVATIGLAVCLPPLATLLFGDVTILRSPGLAPVPVAVYDVLDTPVTLDQLIVYIVVVVIVVTGAVLLRLTDVGLRVRALVDSPAMTSLSGTDPRTMSAAVWVVSVFLAGVAGVLSAPIVGLGADSYTLIMVASFACVIAARLRSLPVTVTVAFAMGILTSLVPYWLPASSTLARNIVPSIPFVVIAVFIVYSMVRRGGANESSGRGGALDLAIAAHAGDRFAEREAERGKKDLGVIQWGPLGTVVIIAVLPLLLSNLWVGMLGQGVAFGIVFLSMTLVTGQGGMIWLCQAAFAGIGGICAAQLATELGWPPLLAIAVGGLMAAPFGVVIGLLTTRMGNLYIALVTLSFGLLADNLLFSLDRFVNLGIGVDLPRPAFAGGDRGFVWLALTVFGALSIVIINVRRSTTGLALSAARSSEAASRTIGLGVVQTKVIVAGLAAFMAGIGGAMLAAFAETAVPSAYATLIGMVWLAVLIATGTQSNIAALVAGVTLTVTPALVLVYLPQSWAQIPTITFGVGAAIIASNPEGYLAQNKRYLRQGWQGLSARWRRFRAIPQSPANQSEVTR